MKIFLTQNQNDTNCSKEHEITSYLEFFDCYSFFFQKSLIQSSLTISLMVSTVVFNVAVIYCIKKNLKLHLSLFDKILIGHTIVDALTGLIIMPFYHINDCFGYWPLDNSFGHLWATFDNSINTVTNVHMLYLCWSRLRSIQNPKNFHQEFLLKHPEITMLLIWLISALIWAPQVFVFGLIEHTLHLNIDSVELKLTNTILFWFLPMLGILVVSSLILIYLKISQRRKEKFKNTKSSEANKSVFERLSGYHLSPHTVFIFMMSVYWLQWIIPCLTTLLNMIPNVQIISEVYWLTYTVCLSDALILLILNPNVSFLKSKIRPMITSTQNYTITR